LTEKINSFNEIDRLEYKKNDVYVYTKRTIEDFFSWVEIRTSGCVGIKQQYEDLDEIIKSDLKLKIGTIFNSQEEMMKKLSFVVSLFLLFAGIFSACNSNSSKPDSRTDQPAGESQTVINEHTASAEVVVAESEIPAWFEISLTDVQTGETFSMADFSGKVVLVETMAMWCPNCIVQANEVRNLHELLDHPDDLVSVSLDVDVNEDAASLKEYSEGYGFEWHFAIAPLELRNQPSGPQAVRT